MPREKRGWSQEDLAREIDVSLSRFSARKGRVVSLPGWLAESLRGSSKKQELMARKVTEIQWKGSRDS